jgi:hypothetical protein
MKTRTILMLLVCFVLLMVAVCVIPNTSKEGQFSPINVSNLESAQKIKKITVLSGNALDIRLWDERRILGYLEVRATPEAAKAIIELLNDSTNPEVILHERKEGNIGDGWSVTIIVNYDGNRINLSEWLVKNKLVWE